MHVMLFQNTTTIIHILSTGTDGNSLRKACRLSQNPPCPRAFDVNNKKRVRLWSSWITPVERQTSSQLTPSSISVWDGFWYVASRLSTWPSYVSCRVPASMSKGMVAERNTVTLKTSKSDVSVFDILSNKSQTSLFGMIAAKSTMLSPSIKDVESYT